MKQIKAFSKNFLNLLAGNDFAWNLLNKSIIPAAQHLVWEHERLVSVPLVDIDKAINELSPELIVQNGPFKGLRYPEMRSVGSALFPKLLGSYECELHAFLETALLNSYTEIVDIGCAEGYYAVGIALRLPEAKVFAYDIDPAALQLCRQMADLNAVSDRIEIGPLCDYESIRKNPFTQKALIISDCEGYEKTLFTPKLAVLLESHDLLIEIHDFVDIEISQHIRDLFRETHELEVFQSVDDIKKAQTYEYVELENYTLVQRKKLLAEYRPCTMEWYYLKSRQNQ